MVSCSLYGRAGNQYFQVSATIAYSLKHNMYYSIPKHGLNFGVKTHYKFSNQTDLKVESVSKSNGFKSRFSLLSTNSRIYRNTKI